MATRKKMKGLGDVVAAITTAVGMEPCEGCNERKETLNKMFPFGTLELLDEEKQYLSALFASNPNELNKEDQTVILNAYFRAYQFLPKDKFEPCINCAGVWNNIIKKLKKLNYD